MNDEPEIPIKTGPRERDYTLMRSVERDSSEQKEAENHLVSQEGGNPDELLSSTDAAEVEAQKHAFMRKSVKGRRSIEYDRDEDDEDPLSEEATDLANLLEVNSSERGRYDRRRNPCGWDGW